MVKKSSEFKKHPTELKKFNTANKNTLFIISGPSGVGEDSVIKGLEKCLPIEKVITTTTRKKRLNESQGNPYYFVSVEKFKKEIAKNRFFEYTQQYNNQFYGVTKKEIKRVINSGKIGIWKIEYKGVIAAKKLLPQVIAILIAPPSLKILKQRLLKRGESEEFIQQRIGYTKEWLRHKDIYDYQVINKENKLPETVDRVKEIILAEI
jgi:guanylate kinase